jgi:hypothetical protein
VVRFSVQYQGWQRRPARCCNPANPGAPTGPSRLARADAPATVCTETLTMRSSAWFVMSPPRWSRHLCLALLASRRRGHRASSITTGGPIRRARSRTAICPAGPANNHTAQQSDSLASSLGGFDEKRCNKILQGPRLPRFLSALAAPACHPYFRPFATDRKKLVLRSVATLILSTTAFAMSATASASTVRR